MNEMIAILKKNPLPLDGLYDAVMNHKDNTVSEKILQILPEELTVKKQPNNTSIDQDSKYSLIVFLMLIWLPYQIRCNYFHSNTAMPAFMYAEDPLVSALQVTNHFLNRWLTEQLPYWLTINEWSEEQKQKAASVAKIIQNKKS